MKNALLICLVILFSFLGQTVHAQYGCNCNITPAFKRFLKTKKLVVQLSGNAAYDTAMAHALARYWKIMPYELASAEAVYEKMHSPSIAFLLPLNITLTTIYHSSGGASSGSNRPNDQLAIIAGGSNDIMPNDIIAFNVYDPDFAFLKDRSFVENAGKSALEIKYRLNDVVATLNHTIELLKEDECGFRIDGEAAIKYMNEKFYNPLLPVLKTKTLILKKAI